MADDLKALMKQKAAERSDLNLRRLSGQAARLETVQAETAVTVARKDIERDPAIQVRVGGLNEEKVVEYMTIIENGGEMPPIVLFRDEKTNKLYLADGFHRDEAEGRLGHEEERAEIRPGGYAAAIEYAEEANLAHGLYLSYADKRNIFERRLKRGHEWVRMSDREIARQLAVNPDTIGAWRRKLTVGNPTVRENSQIRTGGDGRAIRTGGIAAANRERAARKTAEPEPPAPPLQPASAPPPAAQDEIEIAIMAALAGDDLVWHELLRAVKSTTSGEVEPPAFNQALRTLLDVGQVVPSQHDQAAFALPSATDAENATVGDGAKNAPPDFTWSGSEASVLSALLQDVFGLNRQQLESDCTQMSQKAADRLRREVEDAIYLLSSFKGWLQ